jgi:hypothetical protein
MHGKMAIHHNTPGRVFAGCGAGGLFLVMLLPVVISERGQHQAKVTVNWKDTTHENGDAWRVFMISNAGPGAIEWDLGHHQWADLNPAESIRGLCHEVFGPVGAGRSWFIRISPAHSTKWHLAFRGFLPASPGHHGATACAIARSIPSLDP